MRSDTATAETVIDALEDAQDYAAFEMAVTADYDAPSAVERELVLRLASLLWRLRRATAIERALQNSSQAAIYSATRRLCVTPDIGDNSYCGFTSVGVQQMEDGEPSERADSLSSDPESPFEHYTLLSAANQPRERSARPAQSLRVRALAPSTSDTICASKVRSRCGTF